ncbi:MAG: MFS transporter [Limnohabitans sp.]|jgi:MFS family permease|nr:MFS transporter [Burkholderiales bacterium]
MKFFYGWRMVGAACAIQFLLAAFLTQALGLYIAVLSDEMGWNKTTLSGAAALQSVEAAIIGPILGWIMDRFGPQNMIRVGLVFFSAGLLLLSQVNVVGSFYISAILMAIGASLSGYFPLSVALVQWFEKFRARALSIMSLGLAMGGLAVPLIAWSMHLWGWRATAAGSGFLVLIFGLPMAGIIRRRPEDHGEHVDGIDPALIVAEQPGGHEAAPVQVEFTAAQAIRTRAFWMLAIGHGLALLVVSAVNVHAITHMKEGLGYSVANASWVIMIMTFGQIAGVIFGASMGDRFDKRKVAALCMLAHGLGMVCLTFATNMAMLVAFGLFHGFAWGLRGPFMSAIRADYFGRNAIGLILGLSAVIIAMGQIGGPMIAGVMADLTGDYRLGFSLLALLSALGSLSFILATKPDSLWQSKSI